MSRAVMQMALEALEWGSGTYDRRNAAITALKQALAEPEQKPVASVTRGKLSMIRGDIITFDGSSIPLYTAPTQHKLLTTHWEGCEAVHPECRKPEQEPVAWRYRGNLHEFDPSDWAEGPVTPLYTASAPRKPLPLKEVERLIYEHTKINPNIADDRELLGYIVNAVRAVERAHGIGEQT